VHGQSATTIWVWERTFDPKSDFAGSIMHRPACTEAVGWVNHDLNRAALDVTALQQAPPQVLLLQSVTASVWDGQRYSDCLGKLYTALSFTGLKIGFVTERQLEGGLIPEASALFVPAIQHFSEKGLAGLRQYKGRLVLVGDGDLLSRDEYGRNRTTKLEAQQLPFRHGPTSWRALYQELRTKLPQWNVRPAVELAGSDQQPVWGVEWWSVRIPQGLVVNLCNYRTSPVTCQLRQADRRATITDVLNGQRSDGPLTLQPLEIRLLRLE
jgi:hypothetical protein